ncbi:MAG: GlmU family protein [Chitinophagales bacterium]|nr:GlmU family protein [Chitinophagales bacterium]
MRVENYILNDIYKDWANLNPLTLSKPVSSLRIGIDTIKEKWEFLLKENVSIKTCVPHLQSFDSDFNNENINIYVNSSVIPNKLLVEKIKVLQVGETLYKDGVQIASKIDFNQKSLEKDVHYSEEVTKINFPWDIFKLNDKVLKADFERITANRTSQKLSSTNIVIGDTKQIFLEEGAIVEVAVLNTKSGPIYVGKNTEIMEGSVVRGGLALCQGAALKLSTKIYGATTVGPHSKVGGEVNNSVIQGYSNKGHDGFLGNSVIGEWCNLGADTNNSNLKNNYGNVRVYNYFKKDMVDSSLQFLGLIMGDHSKCGINTMFNTGTVVGVFANIFGGGFPSKFIPSFSWGGAEGFSSYKLEKAYEVAEKVMERRNINLTEQDKEILKHIFEQRENEK